VHYLNHRTLTRFPEAVAVPTSPCGSPSGGQADVKDNPLALRFDLDAGAADFLSAAMNAESHGVQARSPWLRNQATSASL